MRISIAGIVFMTILMLSSAHSMAREELWFGSYVNDQGQLSQGRYHVGFKGETNQIISLQLAPYGKKTVDFNIIKHDLDSGFITAEWPGTRKKCNFFRYSPTYYSGNWIDGTTVQPMVIKKFNGQDAERQGHWFKASETEIKIIEHAQTLLKNESHWNKNDDRVCVSTQSYSVFCALYQASIDIDGEYRHLRPAIKAVRESIEEKYPKKYDHILVDFNNSDQTTLPDIQEIFGMAQTKLKQQIQKNEMSDTQ